MVSSDWTPLPPRRLHIRHGRRPTLELRRSYAAVTSLLAVTILAQVVAPATEGTVPVSALVAAAPSSSASLPSPTLGDLTPVTQPAVSAVRAGSQSAGYVVTREAQALASRRGAGQLVGTVPTSTTTTEAVASTEPTAVPASSTSTTTPAQRVVLTKQVEIEADFAPDGWPTTDGDVAVEVTAIENGDEAEASGPLAEARSVFLLPSLLDASRASDRAVVVQATPEDVFECHERATQLPLLNDHGGYDQNLVAQMTHSLFECVAAVGGFADRSANWTGGGRWDFANLSEQVAAEAVVVAYCESVGYQAFALEGNNPWGYGGLFQMGASEMRSFGFRGASKFDPVDNAFAAATYFMYMNGVRGGWGGWGPWAVVNTSFDDEVNNQVKVPVLPRFRSTDPDFAGRRGAELPEWAVDPWSYDVPSWNGCPVTGRSWPASQKLPGNS